LFQHGAQRAAVGGGAGGVLGGDQPQGAVGETVLVLLGEGAGVGRQRVLRQHRQ